MMVLSIFSSCLKNLFLRSEILIVSPALLVGKMARRIISSYGFVVV